MENIIIDDAIQLVKYYPNYKASLKSYLDKDVCKQLENSVLKRNQELQQLSNNVIKIERKRNITH